MLVISAKIFLKVYFEFFSFFHLVLPDYSTFLHFPRWFAKRSFTFVKPTTIGVQLVTGTLEVAYQYL